MYKTGLFLCLTHPQLPFEIDSLNLPCTRKSTMPEEYSRKISNMYDLMYKNDSVLILTPPQLPLEVDVYKLFS